MSQETIQPARKAETGSAGPKPLQPVDDVPVDGSYVTLSWTTLSGATDYHVQVAADEGFAEPAFDAQIGASASLTLMEAFPPDGTRFHWRVRGRLGGGWSGFGPVAVFRSVSDEEAIPPPEAAPAEPEAERAPAPVVEVTEETDSYLQAASTTGEAYLVLTMILIAFAFFIAVAFVGL